MRNSNGIRSLLLRVSICVVCLSASLSVSCNRPLEPLFDRRRAGQVWPPSPSVARIRYVGQIRTSADLNPSPRPFQALGDLLVGKKEPDALYGPRAVVLTSDGERLWVADPGGRCVHLFDLANREYRKIERVGETSLFSPVGLCLGPGESFYVCDSESVDIHRLSDRTGGLLETLHIPEDLQRPAALNYDPRTEELCVVDTVSHDIKVLDRAGQLRRIVGRRGDGRGEFNYPSDIADAGDVVWIADTGNQRVQGISRSGETRLTIGQAGDAPGDLALPKGIALDSDGHLYVVDARFENIQVFDSAGQLLLYFGEEGTGPGQFWLPGGIFIDPRDRIWVCDTYNGRIQIFDYLKPDAEPSLKPASADRVQDSAPLEGES